MDDVVKKLGSREVLALAQADVLGVRERHRKRRLTTLALIVGMPSAFLWYRIAAGRPFNIFQLPHLGGDPIMWVPAVLFSLLLIVAILGPMLGNSRSPHVMYRPEQIEIGFDDVKGLGPVVDEVIRTLNVFLGYATFRNELGGNPRRGLLFEGAPGTGKTHLAKAMARHAGVPFLYVSGPAFQSMWYGMTARKIRTFFKALKKTARREGGAIGFIEEIDAFATARGGLDSSVPTDIARSSLFGRMTNRMGMSQGTGGTVNELLIQMQSFESLPALQKFTDKLKNWVNGFLPHDKQLKKKVPSYANVLLIAATNRGDSLDPALLRPGRFDRRLYFDLPSRSGRRELVDYFLGKKRHDAELDRDDRREELAGMTFGYTPVMIEHLLDEALIVALRHGRGALSWSDVNTAKLTEEIGMPHPVAYTADERRQIATHEAGHATLAYLVGEGRRLEVLSIVKRREALGLLGHSETEERFTRTQTELEALLTISVGGMASEEIFEGESGTGPAGDLATATRVAAEMVGSLGMGGSLVSYRAVADGVFDPDLVGRVLSNPETRRKTELLLRAQKQKAKALLKKNAHLVLALRDALLDRDELIGDEILVVLEAAGGAKAQRSARAGVRRGAASRAASIGRSGS
ncbi:MAG: AAA family ATPase [Actinomycetota bacterium]|nr:AAA family ATPase [Actinomycetota bacterium]